MLRISIFDEPFSTTMKLEGKLSKDWASEAERVWAGVAQRPEKQKKIIDLFDVTFVDDFGRQLLVEMNRAGAKLVGSGPMIAGLIEEIQGPAKPRSNGRLKKILFSLLALTALFTLVSRSAAQQASRNVLTLNEAIALAKLHNRQIKIQQLEAASAQDDVAIAKTHRLPSLQTDIYASGLLAPISFEYERGAFGTFPDIGPVPNTKTKVTAERSFNVLATGQLKQPLTQLYRLNLSVRALEANQQIAAEEVRKTEQEMLRDVRKSYYAILQTRSAAKANQVSVASLSELHRVLLDRLKLETALRSDELEVRVALAKAQQERVTLFNSLAYQCEQLNLLLGRDPATDFEVEEVSQLEAQEEDLGAARARAALMRPESRQSELKVKAAELDRRAKKAEGLPELGAFVSYASPFNVDVVPKNIAAAGLQLTWEPFDWGRRKRELDQKQHVVEQAALSSQHTHDAIQIEVGQAFRTLQETHANVEVASLNAEAVQEKLRVVTNQYEQKAALLKDVLDTRSKVAEAEHQRMESLVAFWNAKAEFAKAIGEEQ